MNIVKINIDKPLWARFLARDSSGNSFWFQRKPSGPKQESWYNEGTFTKANLNTGQVNALKLVGNPNLVELL